MKFFKLKTEVLRKINFLHCKLTHCLRLSGRASFKLAAVYPKFYFLRPPLVFVFIPRILHHYRVFHAGSR